MSYKNTKWYGWKRDSLDARDKRYKLRVAAQEKLQSVDLREKFTMPEIFDQGNLGSCHDAETEVLTDSGFKLFKELSGDERLASVCPNTSKIIFEKPIKLHRFVHKGDLYCASNSSLNFKVTGNHKMLVRTWSEKDRTLNKHFELVNMEDVGWYVGLMNRVKWEGEESNEIFILKGVSHKHKPQREDKKISMSSWLRFLGIYLAEGTMIKRSERSGRNSYKIQIAASKEREKIFVREVLNEIGVHALEMDDRFTFSNMRIYEAMSELGLEGVKAKNKFVPSFIFRQSASLISDFLSGHFAGDGCEQNGHRSHYTSSKKLADDLQLLVFLSGNESRISVRQPRLTSVMSEGRTVTATMPEHRVSVCENKNLSIERNESVYTEHYDGIVYCAEVPTYHTLVTRREGKILISGNCTANAIAFCMAFDVLNNHTEKVNPKTVLPFSRLFIYYNERVLENSVKEDSGAEIRDGFKTISKEGACLEKYKKYKEKSFARKPSKTAYKQALKFISVDFERLDSTNKAELVDCLASGYPFVIGFSVYSSFESEEVAVTGVVPMPDYRQDYPVGGHAVACVGYNADTDRFICANSWNTDWGMQGYFSIPAAYLNNSQLADDFWTVKTVL